jgi:hypothetical protein
MKKEGGWPIVIFGSGDWPARHSPSRSASNGLRSRDDVGSREAAEFGTTLERAEAARLLSPETAVAIVWPRSFGDDRGPQHFRSVSRARGMIRCWAYPDDGDWAFCFFLIRHSVQSLRCTALAPCGGQSPLPAKDPYTLPQRLINARVFQFMSLQKTSERL